MVGERKEDEENTEERDGGGIEIEEEIEHDEEERPIEEEREEVDSERGMDKR